MMTEWRWKSRWFATRKKMLDEDGPLNRRLTQQRWMWEFKKITCEHHDSSLPTAWYIIFNTRRKDVGWAHTIPSQHTWCGSCFGLSKVWSSLFFLDKCGWFMIFNQTHHTIDSTMNNTDQCPEVSYPANFLVFSNHLNRFLSRWSISWIKTSLLMISASTRWLDENGVYDGDFEDVW